MQDIFRELQIVCVTVHCVGIDGTVLNAMMI